MVEDLVGEAQGRAGFNSFPLDERAEVEKGPLSPAYLPPLRKLMACKRNAADALSAALKKRGRIDAMAAVGRQLKMESVVEFLLTRSKEAGEEAASVTPTGSEGGPSPTSPMEITHEEEVQQCLAACVADMDCEDG